MSRKRRFIYIKDPRLQCIRYNLRRILELTVKQKEKEAYNKVKTIEKNKEGINRRELSQEEIKRVDELNSKKHELHDLLRKSIVVCSICETTDDHRIYVPKIKEWVCPNCYARTRDLYLELKEHLDKGGSSGDHDMEYYSNFLD